MFRIKILWKDQKDKVLWNEQRDGSHAFLQPYYLFDKDTTTHN